MRQRDTLTIEEATECIIDYRGKTPPKTDSGIRLITAKVIKGGRILDEPAEFIATDFYDEWMRRGLPRPLDVLITTEAPLGEVAILRGPERVALAQRVILLRALSGRVDAEYLYYALQSEFTQGELLARATGTTVAGVKQSELRQVRVHVPPLPVQRRIAEILAAYDHQIENNLRRIQILEQMARALFREWFVEFRFPGREPANRVPSPIGPIPADWPTIDLQNVCIGKYGIQTGPFGSQLHHSDYSEDGIPVVMPKDLIGFRINSRSVARVPEPVAAKLSRHRVQPGDILYGRRGDIGRRAYVMPHQAQWLCGTGCLRLRPDLEKVDGWYLFHHLGRDEVVALIAGRAHGATLPNLNTQLMASVPVLVPPREIQRKHRELTMPIAE